MNSNQLEILWYSAFSSLGITLALAFGHAVGMLPIWPSVLTCLLSLGMASVWQYYQRQRRS